MLDVFMINIREDNVELYLHSINVGFRKEFTSVMGIWQCASRINDIVRVLMGGCFFCISQ
jgi:hypothetical protein